MTIKLALISEIPSCLSWVLHLRVYTTMLHSNKGSKCSLSAYWFLMFGNALVIFQYDYQSVKFINNNQVTYFVWPYCLITVLFRKLHDFMVRPIESLFSQCQQLHKRVSLMSYSVQDSMYFFIQVTKISQTPKQ